LFTIAVELTALAFNAAGPGRHAFISFNVAASTLLVAMAIALATLDETMVLNRIRTSGQLRLTSASPASTIEERLHPSITTPNAQG